MYSSFFFLWKDEVDTLKLCQDNPNMQSSSLPFAQIGLMVYSMQQTVERNRTFELLGIIGGIDCHSDVISFDG